MEGVRVRWKVREQIWPQETYTQALIPLSHRGGEPQALPSALPLDFSDQTMAQRQPRHRTPAPTLKPAAGMVAPAAVIKRKTSNRWLIH